MIVENLSVPFDRRVWRESLALQRAGADVSVICPRGKTYDTEAMITIEGVEIYRYGLPAEGEASASRFTVKTFLYEYFVAILKTFALSVKIYFKKPFHAIHTANPPDIFFLIALPYKLLGVKFIFDHHDLCPESYLDKEKIPNKDFLYRAQVLLEKMTFAAANVVISTNESYKSVAISRGRKKSSSVFVVRNGPDYSQVNIQTKDVAPRNGFKHLVGYIGVMAKLDGVDYLIRAADYIVHEARRNDVGFVLIGSGTSFEELQELTNQLHLNDFVRFTGRIPDKEVFSILSSIDVGVAPDPPGLLNNVSTMNKIMDYMWFGKPIVSFNLAESKFSAQLSAVYVHEANAENLGRAIIELLDNEEQRKRMGELGQERVKLLLWKESAKVLLNAYRELFS
jgi:glycosyltransferase involved in cell wall biosynthesis